MAKKESTAMINKEISFFKKKGAPKSMIRHEMAEKREESSKMKKFSAGGQVARGSGAAVKGNTFTKNG